MISKRIDRSKNSQGNFSALGNYARDASHKGEKCLFAWHEGCQAESYDIALQEIELTQALNTRSGKDQDVSFTGEFSARRRADTYQRNLPGY